MTKRAVSLQSRKLRSFFVNPLLTPPGWLLNSNLFDGGGRNRDGGLILGEWGLFDRAKMVVTVFYIYKKTRMQSR